MSNVMFSKGKQAILNKEIDFDTDTLKAALVKSDFTPAVTTQQFLTDLGANALSTVTLTGVTITDGVFDAADPTWPTVTAGDTASYVVIYKDTGVAATSPLLMFIDTITNFPVATTGGDITVNFDNGANKIFAL